MAMLLKFFKNLHRVAQRLHRVAQRNPVIITELTPL
jgi:hypothetical protein